MRLDPYRLFFPGGVLFALAGAVLWPLYALGWIPYPGPLHRALMIEGFELAFVAGFMLTALSGLTHGGKHRPWELWTALAGLALFALGSFARPEAAGTPGPAAAAAQAGFLLTVLTLFVASGTRARTSRGRAPGEIVFLVLGLLFGVAGGLWQLALALGWVEERSPGLALRLVSLGMVLSLVLGVGGLLVPTFIGTREPLRIPAIAAPHERRGRIWLYGVLALLLAASFAADGVGHRGLGAGMRAVVATLMLLLVWKIHRLPGRRTLHAFTLWSAGWCALLGPWLVVLAPLHVLAGEHVLFLGGFGLLTMGIATRVTVVHGGFPVAVEARTLEPVAVGLVGLAVLFRLGAEVVPAHAVPLLAASGSLWTVAWLAWAVRALPLLLAARTAAGGAA